MKRNELTTYLNLYVGIYKMRDSETIYKSHKGSVASQSGIVLNVHKESRYCYDCIPYLV